MSNQEQLRERIVLAAIKQTALFEAGTVGGTIWRSEEMQDEWVVACNVTHSLAAELARTLGL
jgi:hypothetical protein